MERRLSLLPLIALFTLPLLSRPVHAQDAVEIREWEVPYDASRPRDPYVGPDDRIWFVGQRSHYIAVLDPETGDFQRFDLDDGVGPHNLIVADDGTVWYAGNRAAHIGRMDPETGEVRKYAMPDPAARDPHTLVFGPSGDIWFTLQGANMVGRFDPVSGEVRLLDVPTERARPYGIVVDPSNRPWIALVGTHKLATIDPATMELREIHLPREGARPRRIGLTSDGTVWYVDYAEGRLGAYDPADGSVREWIAPAGEEARPYAMTIDDRDRIWFVETGPEPNRFVGFDPATESFFGVTPVPSGGGTVRHMVFDPESRSIWFGADTNTIGRVRVP